MNEPTIEALAHRLELLERENRRLRRLGVASLAGVAALVLLGEGQLPRSPSAQAAATPPAITAERFVLKDARGRTGAALGWQTDGTPRLDLFDRSGTARAALVVGSDDAPGLALFDADGKPRATFALFRRGGPQDGPAKAENALTALVLYDPSGQVRAALSATPGDEASLDFSDPNGAPRATFGLRGDGTPALRLQTPDGADRATFSVLADGSPVLNLFNREGRPRAALAIGTSGEARLALADRDGKVVWSAP